MATELLDYARSISVSVLQEGQDGLTLARTCYRVAVTATSSSLNIEQPQDGREILGVGTRASPTRLWPG